MEISPGVLVSSTIHHPHERVQAILDAVLEHFEAPDAFPEDVNIEQDNLNDNDGDDESSVSSSPPELEPVPEIVQDHTALQAALPQDPSSAASGQSEHASPMLISLQAPRISLRAPRMIPFKLILRMIVMFLCWMNPNLHP